MVFPGGASDKEPTCQCRRYKRCGFHPWVRKIPWRRKWQPTPVFLPGESHGLWPILCSWNSQGKNAGVGCHFLLQGIFLIQGSNPCLLCLLHWQVDSLPLSHLESPKPSDNRLCDLKLQQNDKEKFFLETSGTLL